MILRESFSSLWLLPQQGDGDIHASSFSTYSSLSAHSAVEDSGGIISDAKSKWITVDLTNTKEAIKKAKNMNIPPSLDVWASVPEWEIQKLQARPLSSWLAKSNTDFLDVITDKIINTFLHKGQGIGHSCTIFNEGSSEGVICRC